jgi:hypothetical protein
LWLKKDDEKLRWPLQPSMQHYTTRYVLLPHQDSETQQQQPKLQASTLRRDHMDKLTLQSSVFFFRSFFGFVAKVAIDHRNVSKKNS